MFDKYNLQDMDEDEYQEALENGEIGEDEDLDEIINEELEEWGVLVNYKPRGLEMEKEPDWVPLTVKNSRGYFARKDGKVKGPRGILKGRVNPLTGYVDYAIRGKHYYAHVLIVTAFGNKIPKDHVVSHENGKKKDNRLENLRVSSKQRNMILHAIQRRNRK